MAGLRSKGNSAPKTNRSGYTKPAQGDFDRSTYVKVNDRIKIFYDMHPEGYLHTERILEEGGVVYRTIILRDKDDLDIYAATGIGKAVGYSYLPNSAREEEKVEEYAETVSVGRALAKFGIEIEKSIASAEEIDQFERVHKGTEVAEPEEVSEVVEAVETEVVDEEEVELPKLKSPRQFVNRGSKFAAKPAQ